MIAMGFQQFRPAGQIEPRPRTVSIFATAIWLGLVVGMLEVILLVAQKSLNHVALIGSLRLISTISG